METRGRRRREYFDAHLDTHNALIDDTLMKPDFDDVLSEITDALLAADVKRHGPARNEEDAAFTRQQMALEAGYLVGVRVGLRLRQTGGA